MTLPSMRVSWVGVSSLGGSLAGASHSMVSSGGSVYGTTLARGHHAFRSTRILRPRGPSGLYVKCEGVDGGHSICTRSPCGSDDPSTVPTPSMSTPLCRSVTFVPGVSVPRSSSSNARDASYLARYLVSRLAPKAPNAQKITARPTKQRITTVVAVSRSPPWPVLTMLYPPPLRAPTLASTSATNANAHASASAPPCPIPSDDEQSSRPSVKNIFIRGSCVLTSEECAPLDRLYRYIRVRARAMSTPRQ